MQQFLNWTVALAVAAACIASTAQAQSDESWSLGDHFLPATSRAKVAGTFGGSNAEEGAGNQGEIAKKLQNPVSDLEYVNFRFDVDTGLGSTDAIRRYSDHALDLFSAHRVMAASNWPVILLGASYEDCWTGVTALASGLNTDERRSVLGDTAERVYGLSEVGE